MNKNVESMNIYSISLGRCATVVELYFVVSGDC